jgi:CubicO group peptidase (beta-lactamase class C family)
MIAAGFEAVGDAFDENFRSRGDVAAQVCVYVDGAPVVDLSRGYERDDAIQLVFSTTKGVTAILVAMLADEGVLDLAAPIAEVWPEFAAHGKDAITLRHVLGHRAGIPVFDGEFVIEDILDPASIDAALERQAPLWAPDSQHGYHAVTYGWIIDGVVRRVTGKAVHELVDERIATPLGLDLWIGAPAEVHDRIAHVIESPALDVDLEQVREFLPPEVVGILEVLLDPQSTANRAVYINDAINPSHWTDLRVLSAHWPAATCVTDARSLARMYAACVGEVDGVRLLSESALASAMVEVSYGRDDTTTMPSRFAHGFHLHHHLGPLLGEGSFGHGGMGGSSAFGDVTHRVGFAYAMTQMQLVSERAKALIDALRACL